MVPRDVVATSWRYITTRLTESVLVVAAATIGIGIPAAVVTFIGAYGTVSASELQHPRFREIVVAPKGATRLVETAVLRVGTTDEAGVGLTAADVSPAVREAPDIEYGYTASRTSFSTSSFAGARGASARMIFPGGEVPPFVFDNADRGQGGGIAGGPGGASERAPGGTAADAPDPDSPFLAIAAEMFDATADDVLEPAAESFAGFRITPSYFDAWGLRTAYGSLFGDLDLETETHLVVFGDRATRTLFPNDDPADLIGKKIRMNGFAHTIVGILEPFAYVSEPQNNPDYLVFVPDVPQVFSFGDRRIVLNPSSRSNLHFAVADSQRLEPASRQLVSYFTRVYGPETVTVTARIDAARERYSNDTRLLLVILALGIGGLFIAGINIFNLMLSRAIKRTRSVGMYRAIGATKNAVFAQFLTEAGILTAIGAVLGAATAPVLFGFLTDNLFDGSRADLLVLNPVVLAGSALACAAIILVAGVVPAYQAARIDPATAVRTE
ncbi:MAG: FtsX-like permease family protein [Spirochaetaceae bacterium]|nr:MAG: FtsX-like permease family protein [Spirochaetaceae bacterium]